MKFNFWSWLFFFNRTQIQFDQLAETHFKDFNTDLAERESGYVLTFDHDLDMFAASISLSRTSVAAIIKEEGLSSFNVDLLGIKFNLYRFF